MVGLKDGIDFEGELKVRCLGVGWLVL